jgi:hypothetical protein
VAGDSFQVLIQAQIATIGYEGVPEGMHDVVDTKFVSDLHDIATGAAMTLTSAYDSAKTAATVGAKMDLVDAPNSTAVTAIASADATAVWGATVRALSSGGVTAIASAVATAVWAASTRTLTSFGTLVADTTSAVWSAVVRTITGGGGGSGGASAADIWGYTGGSGRTLSATPASPTNVTDAEAAILAAISEIPGGGGGSGATVMISDPGVTIE